MQFISTKYLGPTNHRPGRIKAWASFAPATVTVPYDHALSQEGNHDAAAKALAVKLGWAGDWVSGGGIDGNVYVFVTEEPRP